MKPIKIANPRSCYGFSGLVVFRQASLFEYGFIHCIQVIIVLGLLLYLRYCYELTKGEIVRVVYFGIVKQCPIMCLLLNFFVLFIFWFCSHLHTSWVVSIYDDDVCVSLFISHVLFLFSLYTHVSCLFNLSLFSTLYLDASCLMPFKKDKLNLNQDSKPSSCSNFQGSDLLDQTYFVINVFLWFCHKLPKKEIIRFIFYEIGLSYDKIQFTCLLFVIVFHMVHIACLLSDFRKDRYEANQNSQSQLMLWFLKTSCFQIGQCI